jgi:hypothetical protein
MASEKIAIGECDVCGFEYPLRDLKKNTLGFRVCPSDWDGRFDLKNHPQNKNPNVRDSEFIKDPRPPQSLGRNVIWNEYQEDWENSNNDWNTV